MELKKLIGQLQYIACVQPGTVLTNEMCEVNEEVILKVVEELKKLPEAA